MQMAAEHLAYAGTKLSLSLEPAASLALLKDLHTEVQAVKDLIASKVGHAADANADTAAV